MNALLAIGTGVAIVGGIFAAGWLLWQLVKILPWWFWLFMSLGE